jgi:peptidoglycan hydrolase-like protein with peptidoglycan-binding domain
MNMKGAGIAALQEALASLGYFDGAATGTFDGATQAAVKALQRDAGLSQSGALDAQTLEDLTAMLDDPAGAKARVGSLEEQRPASAPVRAPVPPPAPDEFPGAPALAHAQEYVGIHGGPWTGKGFDHSQDGPDIMQFTGGKQEAWCADFVRKCFDDAGVKVADGRLSSWVPTMVQQLGDKVYQPGSRLPQPGDIVFFEAGGHQYGHVGIVEQVGADGTIHTIEGNSLGTFDGKQVDGVWRHSYSADSDKISAYARP